jgi:peptidoglycan lytic transglycosylase G
VTLTRRGKIVSSLAVLGSLALVAMLAFYLFMRAVGVYGSSSPGRVVEIEIPKGAGSAEIGEILAGEDVIKSALGWKIALFLHSGDETIQAGLYRIATGLTAPDAIDSLLAKPPEQAFTRVTFPEGSWLADFAQRLNDDTDIDGDEFLRLATSGKVRSAYQPDGIDTLEGLLFPSTYQVIESDTPKSVLARLVKEMETQVGRLDLSQADGLGYSPYEAITIASMVEAEAKVDEDRAKIARVIYNRLDAGMRLGIDATIDYALGEHKTELTSDDLAIDSPYNTRLVTGLPPTPIGAPGLASLKAALAPEPGDWLYYVLVDCDGHHSFSTSYDDFLRDKATYQSLSCG